MKKLLPYLLIAIILVTAFAQTSYAQTGFVSTSALWRRTANNMLVPVPSTLRIGIGSTTAAQKLYVGGDLGVQGNYIQGSQWLSLQQNGFGSGFHMAQFATSSNDVTGIRISNMATGTLSGTGYILTNDKTTLNVAGLLQSYYGGLFMFGSNFNGAPFGITAVGPNDVGLSNTDGKVVISAASSTGSIDFYAGTNGYLSGTIDMRLTSLGNFGIGSTTAAAKLAVQGTTSAPTTDLLSVASSSMLSFMNIKATGNIGMGTTTPTTNLHVTAPTANATTTLTIGRAGMTKGTCIEIYTPAGAVVYLTASTTAPTGLVGSTASCK